MVSASAEFGSVKFSFFLILELAPPNFTTLQILIWKLVGVLGEIFNDFDVTMATNLGERGGGGERKGEVGGGGKFSDAGAESFSPRGSEH